MTALSQHAFIPQAVGQMPWGHAPLHTEGEDTE